MVRKKPEPYKIPFVKKETKWGPPIGSVPDGISPWQMRTNKAWRDDYDWRDNVKFEANIRFVEFMYSGKAVFENTETNALYYMSRGALEYLIKNKSLVFGCVLGTWKFKKHGTTYSIWPVL